MTRIRVNTEDLKSKARDFESAADAFSKAGDDILAAAMAMPSYDGQLSGPARKAGYEIQSGCRDIKAGLAANAESFRKTAQAFEDVDNQTVKLFGENTTLLSDSPLYGGPGGELDAPLLNTNMDKLNYMINLSKPGDVLQVRMPDGKLVTFIITHDAEGNLFLWNVNEGRAWDGEDAIFFLANSATDVALYHMEPDGRLSIDQTPGARIGDDTKVPVPFEPVYWSRVGMLDGADDPATPSSPSTDNGYLFYEKEHTPYDGWKIIVGAGVTIAGTTQGPLGWLVSGASLVTSFEDYCKWLNNDYSITDVEYHPGINPPFSPLDQLYPP